jgi:hypothetical protein
MKILSFDVGIVNLAYCILEVLEGTCKILYWEIINTTGNNGNLYITLITHLDSRDHLLDVDTVIIEKQPSFNPKMRIIAGCLQTYFYIRGIVDKSITNVELFSPKNKLKCYTGAVLTIDSKTKSKYSKTKKMGILIAETKLNEYSETKENKELFRTTNKKDDLSDCYLQALTWSTFKKLMILSPQTTVTFYSKDSFKNDIKLFLDTKESLTTMPEKIVKYLNDEYQIDQINKESLTPVLESLRMKKYIISLKT